MQNLRKQVMTTNLWIEQFWYDYKLKWNPEEYGGEYSLNWLLARPVSAIMQVDLNIFCLMNMIEVSSIFK